MNSQGKATYNRNIYRICNIFTQNPKNMEAKNFTKDTRPSLPCSIDLKNIENAEALRIRLVRPYKEKDPIDIPCSERLITSQHIKHKIRKEYNPINKTSPKPAKTTPVSTTPVSAAPVSGTLISTAPVPGTPISAVSVSAIPVSATPVSATPVSARMKPLNITNFINTNLQNTKFLQLKNTLINQLPCNKCQQSPNCTKCHPDLIPERKVKYTCDPVIWNGSAYGLYQISKAARINRGQQTPKAEILRLKTLNMRSNKPNLPVAPLDTKMKSTKKIQNTNKPSPYTHKPSTKENNNKHSCPKCGEEFARKWCLDRHQRKSCTKNVNSDYNKKSRPFKCEQCLRSFGLKKNLRQHFINKHIST